MKKKTWIIILLIAIVSMIKLEQVKADTYAQSYFMQYYSDSGKTNTYPSLSGGIISYKELNSSTSTTVSFNDTNFYFNNNLNLSNYKGGYLSIPFDIRYTRAYNTTTSTIYGNDECKKWSCNNYTSNGDCIYTCTQWSTSLESSVQDRELIEPQTIITPIMYFNVGGSDYWVTCNVNTNLKTIECPIKQDMTTVNRIRISSYVFYSTSGSYQYIINVGRNISAYSDMSYQIIQQQQQNTQEIINNDHNYTNSTSENINGTQEMDEYKNTENSIIQSLNFTALDNSTVNLDMSASSFIWDMVERIRGISTKIVSFMTSILALGIFKMILNR